MKTQAIDILLARTAEAWIGCDEAGKFVFWNKAAESLLGWTESDVIGHRFDDFLASETDQEHFNNILHDWQSRDADLIERSDRAIFEIRKKGDHGRMIEWLLYPIHKDDGGFVFYGSGQDLSLSAKVRESWKVLFSKALNVPIQIFDVGGRVLYWNPAAEKVFGFTAQEAEGRTLDQTILSKEDADDFAASLKRIQETRHVSGPKEWTFKRRDGSMGTVISTTLPLEEERPGETLFLCMDVDVSQRVDLERSLREKQRQLDLALHAASAGAWSWDLRTDRVTFIPGEYPKLTFGLSESQADYDRLLRLVLPEDRCRVHAEIQRAAQMSVDLNVDYRIRRDDGEIRWLSLRGVAECDTDGLAIRVVGIVSDVTERKQTEENLDRARLGAELLSSASQEFSSSLDFQLTTEHVVRAIVPKLADICAVFMIEPAGRISLVAAQQIRPGSEDVFSEFSKTYRFDPLSKTGISQVISTKEPVFYPILENHHLPNPERNPVFARIVRAMNLKSVIIMPLLIRQRLQGVLFLGTQINGRVFEHDDFVRAQELARIASTAIDHSQIYSEAMRAIESREEFISVASHELKTPLTSLSMQIQLINRMLMEGRFKNMPEVPFLDRMVVIASHQIDRLTNLVNELLDISLIKKGVLTLKFEEGDLSEIIQSVIDRLSPILESSESRIDLKLGKGLFGRWDRSRMEQVIENLVSNALKYGLGKSILIESGQLDGRIYFSVHDYGIGISPADQERIFQRFARASSVKRFGGIGLGLYISRQIVEAHGGRIKVESDPQVGTIFTVELSGVAREALAG